MNPKSLKEALAALFMAKKALTCPTGEFANICDKFPEKLTKSGEERRSEVAVHLINTAGHNISEIVQMAEMIEQAFRAGRASAGAKDEENNEDVKEEKPIPFGFAACRKGSC